MVTLLETKLNSLPPEITSNYPPLVHQTINDVNPIFVVKPEAVVSPPVNNTVTPKENDSQNNQNNQIEKPTEDLPQPEEKKADDDTPEGQLRVLLEENPNLDKFHKMLKYGIPSIAIEQKARFEGTEVDLITVYYFL